jgi:four helix bundle protein
MGGYKDLIVWQKALDAVVSIYEVTDGFDKSEKDTLTQQLRRAAISVPSNIAEGSQRGSDADFIRFLNMSRGSAAEIETQLIIAEKLKYITNDQYLALEKQIKEIGVMLNGLIKSLRNKTTEQLSNIATQQLKRKK